MLTLTIGHHSYSVDVENPIDISIPLVFGGPGPNAFHLPRATVAVAEGGTFIGDTRRGGSCNCETVTLNPHGNGTHTECVGHLSRERLAVRDLLRPTLVPSLLISLPLRYSNGARTLSGDDLVDALTPFNTLPEEFLQGLIIRSLPNDASKRFAAYSGADPPFPSGEAMAKIRELGVRHLLLDLPSADREDDSRLTNHRIFWSMSGDDVPSEALERTITEMVFVEDAVPDGPWLLNIQIPPFVLDAAPSRPILYRIDDTRARDAGE